MRNPKHEGSNLYDCRVQTGPCPNNCNQCFYNRPNAYYEDIEQPHAPLSEAKNGIIRMNCGHDSNIERERVIEEAKKYPNVFFNTSIAKFDFPGPVVFTANPKEENPVTLVEAPNLMFVRMRVSSTNLYHIKQAVHWYTQGVGGRGRTPIVLTFMAYYNCEPSNKINYVWKKRHINSYWCPTPAFMREVLARMKKVGGRLVTMCGTPTSSWCKDCRNCETYYHQTVRYMKEEGMI